MTITIVSHALMLLLSTPLILATNDDISSALPALPQPTVSQNMHNQVVVSIEPFWTQSQWKSLEPTNLTLYYEYSVKTPEKCNGDLRTEESTSGASPILLCTAQCAIDIKPIVGPDSDYDSVHFVEPEVDDEPSTDVNFDRDVFDSAAEVTFFIRVGVRKPGDMVEEDATTTVESKKVLYEIQEK
ncbi:hypothetical protein PMAYCL1PPCAC_16136 [Pristionchus mayeri]|uniref:Uncharacterized protein n=1 Tax=Pristionchus mayeri TaxID=1317129 RepID=A0AAN5CKC2_9BILA|nr:hypothetical protein PMAYCL1PPCAC_16136 [Pristionchus mayeri]